VLLRSGRRCTTCVLARDRVKNHASKQKRAPPPLTVTTRHSVAERPSQTKHGKSSPRNGKNTSLKHAPRFHFMSKRGSKNYVKGRADCRPVLENFRKRGRDGENLNLKQKITHDYTHSLTGGILSLVIIN